MAACDRDNFEKIVEIASQLHHDHRRTRCGQRQNGDADKRTHRLAQITEMFELFDDV